MTTSDIVAALALPPESRVDQRVPKKLLVENGAPTVGDKRQINEGIEELLWLAALKPSNIGVPEYRDTLREYLEIAVLSLVLRSKSKTARLVELIHRAIPYPVLLISEQSDTLTLSLAHKRLALNEAGKVVLEDIVVSCELTQHDAASDFLSSLKLNGQPRNHLFALYQGWVACLEAFLAAQITGRFVPAINDEAASTRRDTLAEHARLQREIDALRTKAVKELQINHRVGLNLEIKRLEVQLTALIMTL